MVRRGGEERLVDANGVVPGDWLVLTEGESVPADARVVSVERLRLASQATLLGRDTGRHHRYRDRQDRHAHRESEKNLANPWRAKLR
ncbi:MAG: hypothetical protein HYX74_07080 [Acidobacteria bacterium]|nr:hypothetical protein [Acidobacteriota bacterium]